MAIPNELKELANNFFFDRAGDFDLATKEECGLYIEAFVRHAQNNGFKKVGHLRKPPSKTHYNGHAIDSFLYKEANEEGLMSSVDIIANAESKPPYNSINRGPGPNFDIDEPRYKAEDWLEEPMDTDNDQNVKFPNYESLGGDNLARKELGRAYAYDALRAGQSKINSGTVIWPYRVLFDTLFEVIVHGKDAKTTMKEMVEKQRADWCKIMGIPVVPIPADFER